LLQEVNRVKNRIGQMCEAGNIKVSSVASDLFGVSGRRMLQAIAEGKRDAGWMADFHVSRSQEKNALLLTRAFEERAKTFMPDPQLAYTPLGSGPCAWQDRTSICCLRPVQAVTDD
jgi:hypothetical protein